MTVTDNGLCSDNLNIKISTLKKFIISIIKSVFSRIRLYFSSERKSDQLDEQR